MIGSCEISVEDRGPGIPAEHLPLEWETPLFHQAISQFEQVVPYAEVSDAIVDRLSVPERSLIVAVPIKLDDGRRAVFPGY